MRNFVPEGAGVEEKLADQVFGLEGAAPVSGPMAKGGETVWTVPTL
jgi:hypothetical protein